MSRHRRQSPWSGDSHPGPVAALQVVLLMPLIAHDTPHAINAYGKHSRCANTSSNAGAWLGHAAWCVIQASHSARYRWKYNVTSRSTSFYVGLPVAPSGQCGYYQIQVCMTLSAQSTGASLGNCILMRTSYAALPSGTLRCILGLIKCYAYAW